MPDYRRFPAYSIPLRVLLFTTLAAVLIAAMAYAYLQFSIANARDRIAIEETHHVQIQASVLSTDLSFIAYFLSFLRDQVQEHDPMDIIDPDSNPVNFEQDLLSMMRHNKLFDQIRLIDASGMERVRVDAGPNGPLVVSKPQLQYKGDKSYFHDTMTLPDDAIYISPLELNMEHGKVERPFKPVIRFGMSVLGENGKPLGIVMINHNAAGMLNRYRQATLPTTGIAMLLNTEGYCLSHPDPEQRWGFMFANGGHLSLANTAPAMWARIRNNEHGQFTYQGSIVSFTTVRPLATFTDRQHSEAGQHKQLRYWKVVSQFPLEALAQRFAPMRQRIFLASLLIWILLSLLIAAAVKSRASRIQSEGERIQLLTQLQSLSTNIMQARDQERAEIARALHDEFGQMASVILMRAEMAEQALGSGDTAAVLGHIHKLEQTTSGLINTTREILKRLSPGHLHELGLIEAVKDMCHQWHAISHTAFTVATHGDIVNLAEPTALHLYRITQESLTNIVRHAHADHADLTFHFHHDHLMINIHDDGCGFDVHGLHEGLGLVGMSRRVQAIGASLHMDSSPENGTRLIITAPLAASCKQDKENP